MNHFRCVCLYRLQCVTLVYSIYSKFFRDGKEKIVSFVIGKIFQLERTAYVYIYIYIYVCVCVCVCVCVY